ncbi:MAG: hypothetical protein ASARMPREDX12_009288 [Alectoria sarmentosa]|nr:MAG: hypothetical protein ASARMPREDX12_009288 [Alectoria sarmentosa]
MDSQYGFAIVQAEQQSKRLSPQAESTPTPDFQPHYHAQTETLQSSAPPHPNAANAEKIGFLALPREIRDQIHFHLVVAADPIQYDENFQTLSCSNTFTATAMMWMFEDGSNAQIAREACETFYQENTFLVYTHHIAALLSANTHKFAIVADVVDESGRPTIHSIEFDAGAWVRKLAVRVGWHASGGWFPDQCCLNPASDLRILLESDGLRNVIIDAKFGAWSYGYPQGIGWELLEEMKEKWGKNFRIYNDQTLSRDTRRYTSDRRDLSNRWLPEDQSSHGAEEAEAEGRNDEQEAIEHEALEKRGEIEEGSEDAGEEKVAVQENRAKEEETDGDNEEALSREEAKLEE